MSPRAAWRLESLGFKNVFEYAAGEADWAAAGLPMEGTGASRPRIGERSRKDVPTARLDDRVRDIRPLLNRTWDSAIVVNENNIVLGRIYSKQLKGDSEKPVEEVMKPGPSTFRPNVSAEEMLDFMRQHDLETALVTTSEGVLLGLVMKEDLV